MDQTTDNPTAAGQNGHNPKWPQPKWPQTKMATIQNGHNPNGHKQKKEISRKVRDLGDKRTVDKCFNWNYKRKGEQFGGF